MSSPGLAVGFGRTQVRRIDMSIKFHCCFCGHKLRAAPAMAGRRAKCPQCSKVVAVPQPDTNHVIEVGRIPRPAATAALPAPVELKSPSVVSQGAWPVSYL